MVGEPKYDDDVINLGYLNSRLGKLDTELGNTNTLLLSKTQNFGTLPQPPYHRYDTYMGPDGIYICHTERRIGEYSALDWGKASTYENVGDAFDRGIITAGTLQAVNGGNYAAGMTGQGTGDGSVRIWAGSTYANRANAPFRVTQGGAGTASNINITGGSLTWNNLNKPTKNDLGGWTTYINDSGIYTGTLTAGQVNAVEINADSITTGTITGRTITGSTINGSSITADSSISITRSGGSYFFNMGVSTSHPNVSGINIGWGGASFGDKSISLQSGYYWNMNAGMIINCDGLRKDTAGDLVVRNNNTGSRITIGSGLQITAGNIDLTSTTNSFFIGSTNMYNDSSNRQCLRGIDGATIRLGSALRLEGGGSSGVFAAGNGKSSDLVLTGSGGASSQNVKKNIQKIENESYTEMLEILDAMNLYTYDYKYDLYAKREQYGFIIDEIEEIPNYEKYFDFEINKAHKDGEHLDFATPMEQPDLTKDIIEVKKYDSNVLDKYLLGVCKALLNKTSLLENELNTLKEEIKDLKGGK